MGLEDKMVEKYVKLDEYESNVKSYCRDFPTVFHTAKNAYMYNEVGDKYLDFFAGAGALNYGHNNDEILAKVLEYIQQNGIMHSLDMYTTAKFDFMQSFIEKILKPRNLNYKLLFPGPTGTNGVEVALKIARKVTNRQNVFSFMGAFHGMTVGSLSLTSSLCAGKAPGVPLNNVTFVPFPDRIPGLDTIDYIANILEDDHSGIEKPAAIFVETVQAEGGINVASIDWLKRLRALCDKYEILLVCDEIQIGCGRTGHFFSFERANIVPDIVVMSKSLSGCGLPMTMVLLKKELDCLKSGEHSPMW